MVSQGLTKVSKSVNSNEKQGVVGWEICHLAGCLQELEWSSSQEWNNHMMMGIKFLGNEGKDGDVHVKQRQPQMWLPGL